MLEYTTPHTPQLNRFIERRFAVIKKGVLEILLNAKLNDTAQKILSEEAVCTRKRVRNSMANTGSTTSLFQNFYGENPRLLVRSQSLYVSDTLLNVTSSRSK